MQIRDNSITPCCGDSPVLDTWDKDEGRSIRCLHCGKHTKTYFMRLFAYEEWEKMNESE